MEWWIIALILGAVEGLTEFLPVSSTGHLIIAGELLNFTGPTASVFDVAIQLGAIMAVVVMYWKRFFSLLQGVFAPRRPDETGLTGLRGVWLLLLTTLPPAVAGLLLHSTIKALFSPLTVAMSLAAGAVCMLLVERLVTRRTATTLSLDDITPRLALGIGCFQCLALCPGFSRSAATIMGGMILGARRDVAAEYSFIAAVPLMIAATGYDLVKHWYLFGMDDIRLIAVGMFFSFVFAWLAVKGFISLMGKLTLRPFAYYRLLLAPLVYWFLVH